MTWLVRWFLCVAILPMQLSNSSMVRASYWNSEGCGLIFRLGLRTFWVANETYSNLKFESFINRDPGRNWGKKVLTLSNILTSTKAVLFFTKHFSKPYLPITIWNTQIVSENFKIFCPSVIYIQQSGIHCTRLGVTKQRSYHCRVILTWVRQLKNVKNS